MSSDWGENVLIEYVESNAERERKQYMMLSEGHFLIYVMSTQHDSVEYVYFLQANCLTLQCNL